MKVKDILNIVKSSSLKNLNVPDDMYVTYVYLAIIELMDRFNFNIKSEVVKVYPELSVYEMSNKDIGQLLTVYEEDGRRCIESDTLDSKIAKFKILNYRSFIYKCEEEHDVICVYKATIEPFTDLEDEVYIPNAAIPAVVSYAGYIGISTLGGSDQLSQRDTAQWYQRFEQECMKLDRLGYKVNIFSETIDARIKGFV